MPSPLDRVRARDCPRCKSTNSLLLDGDIWRCGMCGYTEDYKEKPKQTKLIE